MPASSELRYKHEDDFNGAVQVACAKHGVSPALLRGIIGHETGFVAKDNLTGGDGRRGGSYGLAQVSLKTAQAIRPGITPEQLRIPAVNLDIACSYLADCLHAAASGGYGIDSAISAYNAGGSKYRPGDGPRVGINAGTPEQARAHKFTNQATYVDPVLANVRHFLKRGDSGSNPAYDAHAPAGAPKGAAALGPFVAAAVALFLFTLRR